MKKYTTVDEYIIGHNQWKDALIILRDMILSAGLEETVKWGAPAYVLDNKNIIGLVAFKSYTGLWFHQGVFIKDPDRKLVSAGENTTKALRQWRFNSVSEIEKDHDLIMKYIHEAISNHKEGKVIKPSVNTELVIPDELREALDSDHNLKVGFLSFSKFRQREFAGYIADAKKPETRQRRLEKICKLILDGTGLNDHYRK